MKLQDILPEHRPRERLEKQGSQSLTNAQLLALILKSGTKKENILDLSEHLLAKHTLSGLLNASLAELEEEHGIGRAKACQILALAELSKRTNSTSTVKKRINCASDVASLFLPKLSLLNQEHVISLHLDTKNNLLSEQLVTKGTLNESLIHPREVFHGAIKNLASAVIIMHNHPSGDPTPSESDLKVTKILEKTGDLIGITFLDHIIIGKNSFWSWKEKCIQTFNSHNPAMEC